LGGIFLSLFSRDNLFVALARGISQVFFGGGFHASVDAANHGLWEFPYLVPSDQVKVKGMNVFVGDTEVKFESKISYERELFDRSDVAHNVRLQPGLQ